MKEKERRIREIEAEFDKKQRQAREAFQRRKEKLEDELRQLGI